MKETMAQMQMGRMYSVAPVISEMRKIDITGAFTIPANAPPIAIIAHNGAGRSTPKECFTNSANSVPATAPANNVGANEPATPPPLLVQTVASAFNTNNIVSTTINRVVSAVLTSKGPPAKISWWIPLMSFVISGYPSPYIDGNSISIRPAIKPLLTHDTH